MYLTNDAEPNDADEPFSDKAAVDEQLKYLDDEFDAYIELLDQIKYDFDQMNSNVFFKIK